MQLVFDVSSVVSAQNLIEELRHHEDVRAAAIYENGKILLEIDCPLDDNVIWEVRAAVTTFDETAVEIASKAP